MNSLDTDTRDNIEKIPENFREQWGENFYNPCDEKYEEKTVVRSREDALAAFEKYTDYLDHVTENWSPTSDTLVLVPCGSSKPIGSSTIHQKKVRAVREAGLEDADIVIVSEPCVVVPPEYRLSIPAANYDFPPQYTDRDECPRVFDTFVDGLCTWLDAMNYDTIFPYLIQGHMNKFEAAMDRMNSEPDVHSIPSASYNPDTDSYSGDRFKKQDEITEKVRAVLRYKAGDDVSVADGHDEFYEDRWA